MEKYSRKKKIKKKVENNEGKTFNEGTSALVYSSYKHT